ncbi:uncharacterized protein DFL_001222 [Arthrobotrys flagrans]|uniref:Zn(2)-C6 fungal-type domain-containing protein n=1 Tax=Arthrobotrys flagrans TaxID=97331 RepID=A0A437AGJ0_ARTFL|nr:hypothetical protein DFL_001222 [Arthrobotrys flagrans]
MSTSEAPSAAVKPHRILACVLCQQRKVKCDRKFPCSHCRRVGAQCVPAGLVQRQRRRRFPERELLDRMHTPQTNHASPSEEGDGSPDAKGTAGGKPSNIWRAMGQSSLEESSEEEENNEGLFQEGGDVHGGVIRKAWDYMYEIESNDPLLFGSLNPNIDISTLHPTQAHIFKLWQIYLEHVDPMLKVTHAPTLQTRIIDAVGDLSGVSPALEALLFSIYCVAISSLTEEECPVLFGFSKNDLSRSYQFPCRQALLKCEFLRTTDRDCLTALFLYLVSVKPETDPRSLSSLLAVAIRAAQRMGIHNESTYAKHSTLEAEMRRRLWWSLVMLDHRVCETVDHKTTLLSPIWDCKPPSNTNDFEIQPEMKTPPTIHNRPTEALFAVVRSEIADFIRYSSFQLEFTNAHLHKMIKEIPSTSLPNGGEVSTLEKIIEDKYLAFCNPEIPTQFITIWMARGSIAKNHLVEHYAKYSVAEQQSDLHRSTAVSYALTMLECDTKLMSSPSIKCYRWFVNFYFPFPAYIHILQNLKKRPGERHAEKAWEVMSENYEARMNGAMKLHGPLLVLFSSIVLQAWEAREKLIRGESRSPEPLPKILVGIREKIAHMTTNFGKSGGAEQVDRIGTMNIDDLLPPTAGNVNSAILGGSMGIGIPGYDGQEGTIDIQTGDFDWTLLDWNSTDVRSL